MVMGWWMRRLVHRTARVAYTFVLFNYAAVAGLFKAWSGREVWR